jgi:hypothetical protein
MHQTQLHGSANLTAFGERRREIVQLFFVSRRVTHVSGVVCVTNFPICRTMAKYGAPGGQFGVAPMASVSAP